MGCARLRVVISTNSNLNDNADEMKDPHVNDRKITSLEYFMAMWFLGTLHIGQQGYGSKRPVISSPQGRRNLTLALTLVPTLPDLALAP